MCLAKDPICLSAVRLLCNQESDQKQRRKPACGSRHGAQGASFAAAFVVRMRKTGVMKTHVCLFPSWPLLLSLSALAAVQPAVAQSFPTVTIYATDARASESGSDTGTFTVRRTGSTDFPLAVFYQLSGTASNGVDYEHLGNSVEIPAGALEASFVVKPIDDLLVEGNESVGAALTGSPLACATCGYEIGTPSHAVVFILDNDGWPQTNHPPFVEITSPRSGAVFPAPANIEVKPSVLDSDGFFGTVTLFECTNSIGALTNANLLNGVFTGTWSNVATGFYELTARATDYYGAMATSPPVRVVVVETNTVQQPEVNIYAIDDTGSEIPVVPPWLDIAQWSDSASFTVTRTGPTNLPLTVVYSVGGTASNGVDYYSAWAGAYEGLPGRVTIPAGASSANIQVWVVDDFEVEGTETIELTVPPPPCLPPIPPPPIPPPVCYVVGSNSRAVARILDNDLTPAPVVTIVATDADASERGPDTGTFTVSRTGDTSNPLLVYYSIGGTAQIGVDYLEFTNIERFNYLFGGPNVLIPVGASSAEITVTPIADHLSEGSETVVLQLQPEPWAP